MGSVIYIPKRIVAPDFYLVEYGALYNWLAANDARNIAASGWHLPTYIEFGTLVTYLGGTSIAGGTLKETGLTHWDSPNTGATNSSKFNSRGSGFRGIAGAFTSIKATTAMLNTYSASTYTTSAISMGGNTSTAAGSFISADKRRTGHPVRLVKDSTTFSDGETGTYTGNDGKVYRTICIGTQEWLADNLCETRFRNNDIIPWYGADPANYFTNTEWAALTTAGVCAYDNTLSNVATGFTFP